MSETAPNIWLELAVTCDAESVESVAELFASYGFNQGVAIEEPFTQDRDGDNFAVDLAKPVIVRTFLHRGDAKPETIEAIRRGLWHLSQIRPVGDLEVTERAEDDWANAWKAHYSIHRVGRRVSVRAPWHEAEPSPGEIAIELDPGMAFGTGLHPTTQLCMIALEDEIAPGDRVLDVGIGSGVLAVAAVFLGASAVDGVDIEPVAVRAARENAARNHVADMIRVEEGSVGPGQPFQDEYDLVVANILARVLAELAAPLARAVRPGGTLILGGIIDSKEPIVDTAFLAQDMHPVRREGREDWVAQVWRKPLAAAN